MKHFIIGLTAFMVIAVGALAIYMIDVDQTREARLPDVDVTVSNGQLPEWDATVGNIELTEETTTVPVPELTIEEKEVTVPSLEITPPEDAGTDKDAS